MAGAGIGRCVLCGRDNQPLISDICQDCHEKEFFAGLETMPLVAGDVVWALDHGHKVFNAKYRVEEDFSAGWMSLVKLRVMDEFGNVSGNVTERGRDKITKM